MTAPPRPPNRALRTAPWARSDSCRRATPKALRQEFPPPEWTLPKSALTSAGDSGEHPQDGQFSQPLKP